MTYRLIGAVVFGLIGFFVEFNLLLEPTIGVWLVTALFAIGGFVVGADIAHLSGFPRKRK